MLCAVQMGQMRMTKPLRGLLLAPEIIGSGFVVRSLEAALWAFHRSDSFREGALRAVNLAYGPSDLSPIVSAQITRQLGLSEGSLNSATLPHYCPTEWGTLFRIDRPNVDRVLEYFTLTQPLDCSIPTVIKIGGLLTSVYANPDAHEVWQQLCAGGAAPSRCRRLSAQWCLSPPHE